MSGKVRLVIAEDGRTIYIRHVWVLEEGGKFVFAIAYQITHKFLPKSNLGPSEGKKNLYSVHTTSFQNLASVSVCFRSMVDPL